MTKFTKDILIVPKENIKIHPANDRKLIPNHVEELAEIMRQKGFDPDYPVWGIKENLEDEDWWIIAGKHRKAAADLVSEITHVFLIDKTNSDPLDNILDIVRSNKSKPYSQVDTARNFLYAKEQFPSLKQSEYAARIGVTQGYISQCIDVYEMYQDPQLAEYIDVLPDSALSALARCPESDRVRLAEKASEEGWSVMKLNDSISTLKQLKEYEDSPVTSANKTPEPRKELSFLVPISFVETLEDALAKAANETEMEDRGRNLGLIAGLYLGRKNG